MSATSIKSIEAKQFLDASGRPVVEATIVTEGGAVGRGSAPTGTSVGMYEAKVLRDRDPKLFGGNSVGKAVANVTEVIGPSLLGMDVRDQEAVDRRMIELDGTPDKSRLGGNAIYSLSIACAQAAAAAEGLPVYRYFAPKNGPASLPVPTFNMINGGHYAHVFMGFQEFTVVPYGAADMTEAMNIGTTVFRHLRERIEERQKAPATMGYYCGWAPVTGNPEEMLAFLHQTVVECGWEDKVGYALDCASSETWDSKKGAYRFAEGWADADEIIATVKRMCHSLPILYVEDILDENDWEGFAKASREIDETMIIGDDFTVTSRERLERAKREGAVEGFILKPNQVGTITESMEACRFAKENGMIVVPSLRAGGVVGDIVGELAVAWETPAIKSGAPRSGERIWMQNLLLRASYDYPNVPLFDFGPLCRHIGMGGCPKAESSER